MIIIFPFGLKNLCVCAHCGLQLQDHIFVPLELLPHSLHRMDCILRMNKGCVMKEAVISRTLAPFVAESGSCVTQKVNILYSVQGIIHHPVH